MKKLTKKALQKHLEQSDKEEIIREVLTLFNKFGNVREFYKAELSEGGSSLLDSYKKRIRDAYSSQNPKDRSTNKNIDTLLRDFKKVMVYEEELADLLLYRVECGLEALQRNPRRGQSFYNCLYKSFKQAAAFDLGPAHNERLHELRLLAEGSRLGLGDIVIP